MGEGRLTALGTDAELRRINNLRAINDSFVHALNGGRERGHHNHLHRVNSDLHQSDKETHVVKRPSLAVLVRDLPTKVIFVVLIEEVNSFERWR